jgi:hypothetical protein
LVAFEEMVAKHDRYSSNNILLSSFKSNARKILSSSALSRKSIAA